MMITMFLNAMCLVQALCGADCSGQEGQSQRFDCSDWLVKDTSPARFHPAASHCRICCLYVLSLPGATAKRLNLPSEKQFWSRGITACAVCDGAAPIFRVGKIMTTTMCTIHLCPSI